MAKAKDSLRDVRGSESAANDACAAADKRVADALYKAAVKDRDAICQQLRDLICNLRLSASVIVLAVETLRRQNADSDSDSEVALVLQRHGSDQVDADIERVSMLLASLDPQFAEEEALAA